MPPIELIKPKTLNDLSLEDRKHWELHLNGVVKDTPTCKKEVQLLLAGAELPNIKHPSDIHDWLEHPEMRLEIEVLNG